MSRSNDVRGPTSALTDFLRVSFLRLFHTHAHNLKLFHRHRVLPPLLLLEEQGRERKRKLMSKLSRVQVHQQQLPQLALAPVPVPVELLLEELLLEESVKTTYYPCNQLIYLRFLVMLLMISMNPLKMPWT